MSDDLSLLVSFFKALADESRLRIIGVLAAREATGGELADPAARAELIALLGSHP